MSHLWADETQVSLPTTGTHDIIILVGQKVDGNTVRCGEAGAR